MKRVKAASEQFKPYLKVEKLQSWYGEVVDQV